MSCVIAALMTKLYPPVIAPLPIPTALQNKTKLKKIILHHSKLNLDILNYTNMLFELRNLIYEFQNKLISARSVELISKENTNKIMHDVDEIINTLEKAIYEENR